MHWSESIPEAEGSKSTSSGEHRLIKLGISSENLYTVNEWRLHSGYVVENPQIYAENIIQREELELDDMGGLKQLRHSSGGQESFEITLCRRHRFWPSSSIWHPARQAAFIT
jgi:hypothetical protein